MNQKELSLLLATTEKCEDNKYHCQLMSKLNRRPSGFITDDMKKIILITEKYFRKRTMLLQKHLTEFKLICKDITRKTILQLKWETISSNYELRINNYGKKTFS